MRNTYLLMLEDVLIDVILQSLIGVVYTQLLKTVCLQVLKPKDVQDTNGQALKTNSNSVRVSYCVT